MAISCCSNNYFWKELEVKVFIAQLCLTLCGPRDYSPPGSTVREILQATILEWVATPFSRGSFPPRNQTQVSYITDRFFTVWATREAKLSQHLVTQTSDFVIQLLSHFQFFATPWTAARQAPLFSIVSQFAQIHLHWADDGIQHLLLCRPLLLLLSISPSIRVFSNELALHIRRPKYWSFTFSISPSSQGWISFRIDWFDLLAVQGTLQSLFQHHNSKASILWRSAFFMVQLSYLWYHW